MVKLATRLPIVRLVEREVALGGVPVDIAFGVSNLAHNGGQ